eukprot:3323039-Pyramimonas_sp.AAC.1
MIQLRLQAIWYAPTPRTPRRKMIGHLISARAPRHVSRCCSGSLFLYRPRLLALCILPHWRMTGQPTSIFKTSQAVSLSTHRAGDSDPLQRRFCRTNGQAELPPLLTGCPRRSPIPLKRHDG